MGLYIVNITENVCYKHGGMEFTSQQTANESNYQIALWELNVFSASFTFVIKTASTAVKW